MEVDANVWQLKEMYTVTAWAFLYSMVTPHERAMCALSPMAYQPIRNRRKPPGTIEIYYTPTGEYMYR